MEQHVDFKHLLHSLVREVPITWRVRTAWPDGDNWIVHEHRGLGDIDSVGDRAGMAFYAMLRHRDLRNGLITLIAGIQHFKPGPGKLGDAESRLVIPARTVETARIRPFPSNAMRMDERKCDPRLLKGPDLTLLLRQMQYHSEGIEAPVYITTRGMDMNRCSRKALDFLSRPEPIEAHCLPGEGVRGLVEMEDSEQDQFLEMGLSEEQAVRLREHMAGIEDDSIRKTLQNAVASMPWGKRSRLERDPRKIQQRLDERIFGMDEAKKRVCAAIAGAMLSASDAFHPPALLLHGAPGTGKTALAKAIASSLGIEFFSIPMNVVSTAMDLGGLEPYWRGAKQGKICQALMHAGAMNPLVLLDEIEKAGQSREHGSPMDALLQVLDPVQNRAFVDHYLGVPIDASEIFFIATANDISTVPEPLLDRFCVIHVPEYSVQDKTRILPYLLREIAKEHDLLETPKITDAARHWLERNVFLTSGLREIKKLLWSLLCEAALREKDVKSLRERPVISAATINAARIRPANRSSGIGFV